GMSSVLRARSRTDVSRWAISAGRCPPSISVRTWIRSGLGLGAHLRLVRALHFLVLLHLLARVDVAERGMVGDETLRSRDVEALRENGAEGRHLHLSEAGQRLDPLA